MRFDKRKLKLEADKLGYVRDTYEKVIRLIDILEYIQKTPSMKENLALKGGTAINLFIFDLPRLSVDIDLDFTGEMQKEEMLIQRAAIKNTLIVYMEKNGYELAQQTRYHFSLDSFRFTYYNASGNRDVIKVEINYSLRVHIYETINMKGKNYGSIHKVDVRMIHPYEIFGSKLVALMTRSTPRDLYDFYNMIKLQLFDKEELEKVKKCAVFYRAISNADGNFDFDLSNIQSITQNQIKRFLLPVIATKEFFDLTKASQVIEQFFQEYFMLEEAEISFLKNFENGDYKPTMLFEDKEIISRIQNHPMAVWKTREAILI